MNKEELAYLAGIIDGEGHMDYRGFKNGRGKIYYYARISVNQKDKRLVLWLKSKLGGSISPVKTNTGGYWRWETKGKSIKLLLIAIYPYLIVKREQIDKVLNYIDECKHETTTVDPNYIAPSNVLEYLGVN